MIIFTPLACVIEAMAGPRIRNKYKSLCRKITKYDELLLSSWQFLTREELCSMEKVSSYWRRLVVAHSQPGTLVLRQLVVLKHLEVNCQRHWLEPPPSPANLIVNYAHDYTNYRNLITDPEPTPPVWLRWKVITIGNQGRLDERSRRFLENCSLQIASAEECQIFHYSTTSTSQEEVELRLKLSYFANSRFVYLTAEITIDDAETVVEWLHSPALLDSHLLADAIYRYYMGKYMVYEPIAVGRSKNWRRRKLAPSARNSKSLLAELDRQLFEKFNMDTRAASVPFELCCRGKAFDGFAVQRIRPPQILYEEVAASKLYNKDTGESLKLLVRLESQTSYRYRWIRGMEEETSEATLKCHF